MMLNTECLLEKSQETFGFRQEVICYLKQLRDTIIQAFEKLEDGKTFERKPWPYHSGGGGGEISVLRGKVFEKAAVNWSGVWGEKFPMNDDEGPFFATGVSLITHMSNPHAPTAHMNVRYIETANRAWFGGGYDLTPMGFPYEEDTLHFHSVARETLDQHGTHLYPLFSQNARDYFYIPHMQIERGVGGIFFDHYNTGDVSHDFSMWKDVGETFTKALMPVLEKRVHQPFSDEEKEVQLKKRGHYVEFNLLYDRGTKFGFQSGGNPEAILCSLPPVVKW
ncbi:Coproporphyrinogen-III oxidase, aerobic [Parachlamydia acanthamoebae]|jgi:coproporphyrinogen III oxidase|nr:oxygen-dependent coproporphyrinogen oxidase [Parachlamydia acanthamoebae]KIA76278.1 Coproporphyrinogen-III oxidase, aerobic [Parachlamydia acanthamoebae]